MKFWKTKFGRYVFNNLIHPIRHGTKGCIGIIGTDAEQLFDRLDALVAIYGEIPVKVEKNAAA